MKVEEILEQLFDNGFVEKTIELAPGKVTCKIKNLDGKSQLDVESVMHTLQGSSAYILHAYSMKLLSNVVTEFKGKSFASADDAHTFLCKQSTAVLDRLTKEHNSLEKEIRAAVTPEEVEKSFFQGTTSQEKQGQ